MDVALSGSHLMKAKQKSNKKFILTSVTKQLSSQHSGHTPGDHLGCWATPDEGNIKNNRFMARRVVATPTIRRVRDKSYDRVRLTEG